MDAAFRSPSLQSGKSRRAMKPIDLWAKWEARMQLLRSALSSESSDSHVLKLINESIELYKVSLSSTRSTESLLAALSGKNLSSLEASFMWLGGWRPSSAITLVLSRMGVEVGAVDSLVDSAAASSCLSKAQLSKLDGLLKQTRRSERDLTTELATLQMLLPDQKMAEAIGLGSSSASASPDNILDGRFLIDTKVATLRNLFAKSNRLRLQTLQQLLTLLTPAQAGQCTIAAFELVFAMKMLGKLSPKNCNSSTKLDASSPVETRNFDTQDGKSEGKFSNSSSIDNAQAKENGQPDSGKLTVL